MSLLLLLVLLLLLALIPVSQTNQSAKLFQDKKCASRTEVSVVVEAAHYRLDVHPNNSIISLKGIAAEMH